MADIAYALTGSWNTKPAFAGRAERPDTRCASAQPVSAPGAFVSARFREGGRP
jgi:hypothetical protein